MFLRRISRPFMMMTNAKEATGIVGEVVPNARETLIELYTKTLDELKTIPEKEQYRKKTESATSYRLKVCQEEQDCEKIEKLIGSGQVEELIKEARDELRLIGNMHKWKVFAVADPNPKPRPPIKTGPLPPEFFQALESVAKKAEEKRIRLEAEEKARKEAEEIAKKEAQEAVAAFLKAHADPPPSEAGSGNGVSGNAEPASSEGSSVDGDAEPSEGTRASV